MEQVLAFFEQHGLLAVFIAVFLEQVGAPLPALPVLFLAGAMAAGHPAFGVLALGAAIVASTLGDYAWYRAGRRIPGARPVDLDDLERAVDDIPPGQDMIV
ncbi:DedA family protein [Pelomicrobium sp. G1]|uniref:DedA family protein n=1 Tax=unclassified Pelomicrobium TaxID=2815318 RepID=UPI003F7715E6